MDDTIKILLNRLIKLNQEDFYISPASGFLPMLVSKVMMSYRFNAYKTGVGLSLVRCSSTTSPVASDFFTLMSR